MMEDLLESGEKRNAVVYVFCYDQGVEAAKRVKNKYILSDIRSGVGME